ncbi:uncharacterized protein [Nicotiana tomentosiformis]|uniref:uncharacterized protein n=1 Tax=Nicotiana tomentosiformis TaxID=4098 RepID=UPI00388C7E2B
MARELETETPYQEVVKISRRLEGMRDRERDDREAKRPRGTGGFSGGHAATISRHGRGYVSRPVHLALPVSSGAPGTLRSHVAHFAQPFSSAPPKRGAFNETAQTQEGCTSPGFMDSVRSTDFQAMVVALVAAPHAQPASGGGQLGRGHPRRGGHARFYAFLGRMKPIASDSTITGMTLVFHRDASVLSDLGSTYSYVSSYFAPYLDISQDSLSFPIYLFTPVGYSIVVDRVYWSCLVVIGGFETTADLLLLSKIDFDVILGMDWLSPYHAILDCHAKTMTLAIPGLPRLK